MKDGARALLNVLVARPTILYDAAVASSHARGVPVAGAERDLQQVMRGFQAVLVEALEETGTAARDLFVDTAIGGMLASGSSAADLLSGAASYAVSASHALLQEVAPEERDDAAACLVRFFYDYAAALSRQAQQQART